MKIILADDHALFRDAITHYIQSAEPEAKMILTRDFNGVLTALAEDKRVDLILLDLRMPGMDGLKGLETLKKNYPSIPVALMSGLAEKADVSEAMALGASGYFPKTLSGKNMLQAIYKVLQGERFLPMEYHTNTIMPSHFDDGDPAIRRLPSIPADIKLTRREKEVLEYLLRGVPNKDIAESLGLKVVTVKLHVRGICRKLGVKNRTQAALLAQQGGLAGDYART
ncbi:MAG: response regulator [Micavibrio sp.]